MAASKTACCGFLIFIWMVFLFRVWSAVDNTRIIFGFVIIFNGMFIASEMDA